MRRGLSKGLSQLVGENLEDAGGREVALDRIVPNARQPRRRFEPAALQELAESIAAHGVLSPLLVRPVGEDRYELIAGERRLRAASMAGLERVPVRIIAVHGEGSLEIAIIENVQRTDISAAESASAYRRLMDEFGLSQEEIATRVGKARSSVANTLRLLKLPAPLLEALEDGRLSEGHARALLGIADPARQLSIFRQVLEKGLSVREVERLAQGARASKSAVLPDATTQHLATMIGERLASPVRIERTARGGRITITFADEEDLARVVERLGVQE